MDIDEYMESIRKEREEKRQKFLNTAVEKMDNGELCYHAFVLLICERFNLKKRYGYVPDVAHVLAEHFINNVDEPFNKWVYKNDAPFVRPLKDSREIFHEFAFLENDWEILELANKVYGLDLQVDCEEEYMFSLSFDFNSFTPINIDGIKELKQEIKILEKHNVDCSDLKEQLNTYGLTEEQLELI